MCGAHVMPFSWQEIYDHYSGFLTGLEDSRLNVQAHYNLRPTLTSPIALIHEGQAKIEPARWGLVPPWWKQEKTPGSTFNARRESIEEQLGGKRGMWAPPMKSKRCLVVSGGYYEWTGPKTDRLPWFIHMPQRAIFSFAGLWSYHKDFGASYTIITQPPSANIEHLHHRMPVILKPDNYDAWVSADTSTDDALTLLDDHNDGELVYHRSSKELVNKQKNVPEAMDEIAA